MPSFGFKWRLSKALDALDQSPPMAFELAELQRIEIFLAQNEAERALTHLEFLYQHQLSPWLEEIETAYQQRLTALWGSLLYSNHGYICVQ